MIPFTHRTGALERIQLSASHETIPNVEQGKYLGIIFDSKLNWKPHMAELAKTISRRHNLFKVLVKRSLKLRPKLLINLYLALVRSVSDYSYVPILRGNSKLSNRLEVIQNTILRSILLAPNSTPRVHLPISVFTLKRNDHAGLHMKNVM